ncbi:PRC-barrel domain containing protein [Halalkalibacter alkalisediminis]|uniref:PRC-barrel domain-containing protein n=1 Tax=Halalkalibacter alkalisediminis TaxID=935616 RepID=A0ABV6N9Z6_9BACI|nr:PRC-barrel domain-containing protein [Halalkalibacter alkalisediminis]
MLYKTNLVESCVVQATDGELGKIKDLYFDSDNWVIRYMVIDTQKWLPGRKVLVSPSSFDRVDVKNKKISIFASKQQIESSPTIEEHQPLSRKNEIDLHQYYGWSPYWIGSGLTGMGHVPTAVELREESLPYQDYDEADPSLRSVSKIKGQLTGFKVFGIDSKLGNVIDFAIDDHSWAIHSLIVDTGTWLPGRKVALDTDAIESIDWVNKEFKTNLTSEDVERNASTTDSISEFAELPIDKLSKK